MPRYKLRTLLILMAIGPPMLAGAWLVGDTTTELDIIIWLLFAATVLGGLCSAGFRALGY